MISAYQQDAVCEVNKNLMFFEHTEYILFIVVQNIFGCHPPTTVKLHDLPGPIV